MTEAYFKAPWSAALIVMTIFCGLLCLSCPIGALFFLKTTMKGSMPAILKWCVITVPLIALLGSALFVVRGYRVTGATLSVLRAGWETKFDLSGLTEARVDPDAFKGSLRLFGNGGFFCFAGWFRNQKLGVYRALATDASKGVVLRFQKKVLVVTPDDPARFVAALKIV
jgi:hypothetical protein